MTNPSRGYYSDEQYDIYLDGYDACEDGLELDENPYDKVEERDFYDAWRDGWHNCKYE